MNFYQINFTISYFFNGIVLLILGLFIYFNNKKDLVHRIFALYSFQIAWWSIFSVFVIAAKNVKLAVFWGKICLIGVVFIPSTFLHFTLAFLGISKKYAKFVKLCYSFSIIFLILNFTPFFIETAAPVYLVKFFTVPGIGYLFFLAYYTVIVFCGIFLLFRALKNANGKYKQQILYLFLGTLIGYLGGSLNYALVLRIPPYSLVPWGNYLIGVYGMIVAYAILKHNFMDIRVAITRAGVALGVYSIIFSVPFFIGYLFNLWMVSTVVAIIIAIPAPLIYRYFRLKAEKLIFAQQRNYQKLLLQAGEEIAKEHDLNNLVDLVNNTIGKLTKASFVKTFIQNETYGNFSLKENSSYNEIIQTLIDKKVPINSQQISNELNNHLKRSFNNECALIIPILTDGDLLGFILLGEKKDKSIYSQDDVNIFKILSHQIALAVENCLFFDEFKKAQEKIFNAEKLATIGGLADGVAHQIKNRLNHFSLAAGKMKIEIKKLLKDNPELVNNANVNNVLESLLKTNDSLSSNVQKTNNIIRGILDYAKTQEKETYFAEFSLLETVNQAIDLLKVKHSVTNPPVELVNLNDDSKVYGVKSQIVEVVFNLLDNAYEAVMERSKTQDNFNPKIKIEFKGENNTLIMSDNGVGIKEEDKLKIFAPFFTTKSSQKVSGSGVGMYIVKRLVEENHGGKISFESVSGQGTTFILELPKKH